MDEMIATDAPGNKVSSHSRELQDLALRSAIHTGQGQIAARIADQTSARVRRDVDRMLNTDRVRDCAVGGNARLRGFSRGSLSFG